VEDEGEESDIGEEDDEDEEEEDEDEEGETDADLSRAERSTAGNDHSLAVRSPLPDIRFHSTTHQSEAIEMSKNGLKEKATNTKSVVSNALEDVERVRWKRQRECRKKGFVLSLPHFLSQTNRRLEKANQRKQNTKIGANKIIWGWNQDYKPSTSYKKPKNRGMPQSFASRIQKPD
jgi:hypothetical protein